MKPTLTKDCMSEDEFERGSLRLSDWKCQVIITYDYCNDGTKGTGRGPSVLDHEAGTRRRAKPYRIESILMTTTGLFHQLLCSLDPLSCDGGDVLFQFPFNELGDQVRLICWMSAFRA